MATSTCEKRRCEKKRILRILLLCLFLLLVTLVSTRGRWTQNITTTFTNSKILISTGIINHLKLEQNSNVHEDSKDVSIPGKSGFILVSRYSDQMTGASLNLLSLQCWSSKLSSPVKVVEPFLVKGSKFGFDALWKPTEPRVRLRDILDINDWENQTTTYGYANLSSWTDFLSEAPKNLILANAECSKRNDYDNCTEFEKRFQNPALKFAEQYNFTVVREVCVMRMLYTTRQFRDLVYGDQDPSNSVVLFNYWGGIRNGEPKAYRIGITDMKDCNRHQYSTFMFRSSKTVQKDGKQYIEKHMPLAMSHGYVSVMFRSERFGLNHGFHELHSEEKKLLMLTDCVWNIRDYVNKLKCQYKIQSVFLSMDCRKQGSLIFRRLSSTGPAYMSKELVDQVARNLYQSLYGNSSSLDDWDESFDRIASFKTAGYLAQLQKSLAANGTCLLTAGGGNFQLSAERLYHEIHRSSKTHCIFQVPGCMELNP